MAVIHEVSALVLGFGVPMAGFLAFAIRAGRERAHPCSRAAEELAAARGWPVESLGGEERVAALEAFPLGPQVSPAAIWQASDAAFLAFTVRVRAREYGFVVVTPYGLRRQKPPIGELLRRHHHRDEPAPVFLSDDLLRRAPGVEARRLGERLLVWRPDVDGADALEGLVMAACAILDA